MIAFTKHNMHLINHFNQDEKTTFSKLHLQDEITLNCLFDDSAKKYKIGDTVLVFCDTIIQLFEIIELRWHESVADLLEIEQIQNILPYTNSYNVDKYLKNKYSDNKLVYEHGIVIIESKLINTYKKI